jgi:anaerobic selenocysteine-containing dehydrogenase
MPISAEDRPLPRSPGRTHRVEYSTCYMCACRCGIQVTLENDELRFIQGTRDHPVNQGVLCAKGSAGIMKQRSPAKLRKPLRRKAGALRGRGEFEEIEWDEALAIVEARLRLLPGQGDGRADWRIGAAAWLAGMAGFTAERWLFFTEARHTARLYHGDRST